MKTFRRLFVAALLTATLALPVWAGDSHSPGGPDPGDGHSPGFAAPGDVQTPAVSAPEDINTAQFALMLFELISLS